MRCQMWWISEVPARRLPLCKRKPTTPPHHCWQIGFKPTHTPTFTHTHTHVHTHLAYYTFTITLASGHIYKPIYKSKCINTGKHKTSVNIKSNQTEQKRTELLLPGLPLVMHNAQGCINCGIPVSGIRARGVSSEHMENMEMFSCSPT